MDLRALHAARNYTATKPAVAPLANSDTSSTGDRIAAAVKDFATTLQESEGTAMSAMSGGADAQSLVEAIAQAELAVETAVTVRDKVVEAYQEILRMPI